MTAFDKEHIGKLIYYPVAGFYEHFFPYDGSKAYLSPIIGIQLDNLSRNFIKIQLKEKYEFINYRWSGSRYSMFNLGQKCSHPQSILKFRHNVSLCRYRILNCSISQSSYICIVKNIFSEAILTFTFLWLYV